MTKKEFIMAKSQLVKVNQKIAEKVVGSHAGSGQPRPRQPANASANAYSILETVKY